MDDLFDLLDGIFTIAVAASKHADDVEEERARRRAARMRSLRELIGSCEPCRGPINNGLVQLEGRAVAIGRWRAPVSGRPAIGFRLRVEAHEPTRPAAAPAMTLLDSAMMQDFTLALPDQGGHVTICAKTHCLPLLKPEPTRSLRLEELMQPAYTDLLDRISLMVSEAVSYTRFEVTEFLLEPDEPVFVFGLAYRQVDPSLPAQSYRSLPERVLVGPPGQGVLVVADQDRDSLLRWLVDRSPVVDQD